MIAGVGGASLGTEILKALQLAGGYRVFGCDISPTAYGLYEDGFSETFLVDRSNYVSSVISACKRAGASCIIPGGETPMVLLSEVSELLASEGIRLISNDPEVISTCSDKARTFVRLAEIGIDIPRTVSVTDAQSVHAVGVPCVVKPSIGTGGSAMVFLAADVEEALVYAEYIKRAGGRPIAQEYLPEGAGEFTVGVLSLPTGRVVGSIALRRALDAKLSVSIRRSGGVISSGYSQGLISGFETITRSCEEIARQLGSTGPLNVQGRLRDGSFVPFEINPRFSASTYLRAMAGFNEVDLYLQYVLCGKEPGPVEIREGWYLRSLTEKYIATRALRR